MLCPVESSVAGESTDRCGRSPDGLRNHSGV